MKRAFSLLLALVMVLGLLPPTAQAVELNDGLQYEVYENHVEITGYTGDATEVVIPAEIEGLPVTVIGNYAFDHCDNLTSIDIPNSVTSIGRRAFYCTNLVSIEIPDSITSIDDDAFWGCDRLTSISIPDSVTSIGYSVFSNCTSLTNATLPSTMTAIPPSIFLGCTKLTDIVIPDCVTTISFEAFSYCWGLTSITIPDKVTFIGNYAFAVSQNLTSIYFSGDAPEFGEDVFWAINTTAYYLAGNPTWTADVMQNYGGTITWVPYPPNPFTDVPAGSFYEKPVFWALENGITTGASDTTFDPNGQCLRAQVVTFLHRAAKSPEPTSTVNPFNDVKSSNFFYKSVLWAVEKGITNGVSANKFGSYDVCNRAAVVTFLWRAVGCPEPESTYNPFTDVKTSDFFYKPVLWAVENGITNGLSATEFGPNAACNRAQVVTFLYRAYNG